MKKYLLLLIAWIFLSFQSFAQYDVNEVVDLTKYKNQFRFGPFNFAFSELQMNYERFLTDDFSLKLNGSYMYKDSNDRILEGFRYELAGKYHVITDVDRKSIFRMYFSPFLTMNSYKLTFPDEVYIGAPINDYRKSFDLSSLGGGIVWGINLTFAKRLNMDMYVGGGMKKSDDDNAPKSYSKHIFKPAYSGVYPRAGFDIGFAF